MVDPSPSMFDERSRAVLRAAVETYIGSGSPVASRALGRGVLSISPAGIRAVMATLESDGLLIKPHTSAGRIPTHRGYRTYVDELMAVAEVSPERRERVRRIMTLESETRGVMTSCVNALVEMTGLTGFAVASAADTDGHRHVELVRLRPGEVLAIFASRRGSVLHRHLHLDVDVPQGELDRFQNFLNARFEGLTLVEMRRLVDRELETTEARCAALASRAFRLTDRALPDAETSLEVVVAGQHRLLSHPEFADASLAGPVFEELERHRTWRHLLDVALGAGGIAVMIGSENDLDGLRECAVVAAAVPWDRGVDGTLGLVGPTRLAYGAVISLIDLVRDTVLTHWMRRRYWA